MVEPNTTTTVDESSAPNIAPSESNVPAESTSAVESNTTTTVDDSSAHYIAPNEINVPAGSTIETSNSPQSRAISSESATQLTPDTISFINRQIQEGIRQYVEEYTNMKRSFDELKKNYDKLEMRKKQCITIPDSLQDRLVHFRTNDNGFIINAGLKNDGNSCYLNAYLQVIASLTFLPECLSRPPTLSSERFPLYFSFANVISHMVKNEQTKQIVDPGQFIETFVRFTNAFESFDQRKFHDIIDFTRIYGQLLTLEYIEQLLTDDVHEFRLKLVETMTNEFTNYDNLTTDEVIVKTDLDRFWKRFGYGKFIATRTCAQCNDERIEHPEFTELILHVDGNDNNLETILFNESSNRNDDDAWRCDKCTARARPIKTTRIYEHPRVLCILVQRVSFDRETITYHRQNTKFAFPLVDFNPNNNLHDDVEMYDLIGGIFHHSENTNNGHYTAVCNINHDINKWIKYNDMDLKKTNSYK